MHAFDRLDKKKITREQSNLSFRFYELDFGILRWPYSSKPIKIRPDTETGVGDESSQSEGSSLSSDDDNDDNNDVDKIGNSVGASDPERSASYRPDSTYSHMPVSVGNRFMQTQHVGSSKQQQHTLVRTHSHPTWTQHRYFNAFQPSARLIPAQHANSNTLKDRSKRQRISIADVVLPQDRNVFEIENIGILLQSFARHSGTNQK